MTRISGLGEVPDAWGVERYKWITTRNRRPPMEEDGVVTAFRDGQVTLRSNRRTSGFTESVKEIGYQGIQAGDLAIHSMDAFAGAIGVSESDGKVSPVVHSYQARNDIDARFVAYLLRTMAHTGFVTSLAKGIRERSTSFDPPTLANLELPVPPHDEQRRIADFLDVETARIDRLESLRLQHRSALNELFSVLLSQAFRFNESVPDIRLGYLAQIQTGITVDGSRRRSTSDVTRPYLRVANVQAGQLDLDDVIEVTVPSSTAISSTLRPGDVLMTEGGDLDKLGRGTVWSGQIANCLHQNHVFAVRVVKDRLLPGYLALFTQTDRARSYFESTGIKTTNLASTSSSKIRDLRVPLPSMAQQSRIVDAVTADQEKSTALMEAIERQHELLVERRQALIRAAVTGQFNVTTGRGADLP